MSKWHLLHKRHGDVLNQAAQEPYAPTGYEGLTDFMQWTTEALEYWPLNDGAKVVLDGLNACYPMTKDVKVLTDFLRWIEEASTLHGLPAKAVKMVETLAGYRDRLAEYQERMRQEVRNYWLH